MRDNRRVSTGEERVIARMRPHARVLIVPVLVLWACVGLVTLLLDRVDWPLWNIALLTVAGLVVGLPLNMDGSDSPRTQSVRAFARNLGALGLPILLWDERWSTQAVERAMIDADVSRARRAEKVDALAAAHILQGAIDALANLPPPQ